MPTPIVEQIAVAVETQLLTVTQANGYTLDLHAVVRPGTIGIGPDTPRDRLAVLIQLDPTEDEAKNGEESHGGAINPDGPIWKHWVQPFSVSLFRLVDENDTTTAADTQFNAIRADVEKALIVDPSWGGLAYASFIRPCEFFVASDGAFSGVTVIVEVSYRTLEKDPFLQAPA